MIKQIKVQSVLIDDLGEVNLFVGRTDLLEDFIKETEWFPGCLVNYLEINSITEKLYYYQEFDTLWANWLNSSDQVIKVTQSIDVIKSLLKVAKSLNKKDIRLFRLEKYDNELIITKYNFEELQTTLEMGLDPR